MDRRGFLSWMRSAPVAVPALAAGAMVVSASRVEGNSLYLADKRVVEITKDGTLNISNDLDRPNSRFPGTLEIEMAESPLEASMRRSREELAAKFINGDYMKND